MIILGICGAIRQGNHDGAATIIKDGTLVAAAEEERFVKIKHAPGRLPEHAIRYCLKKARCTIKDVDYVVFPGATYKNITKSISNFLLHTFHHAPPIKIIDHHDAHAMSAFMFSGFQSSYIMTADLSGDSRSTVLYHMDKTLTELASFPKPHSLGLFYALATQYLGFEYNNDECKVMAIAAYGKPSMDLSCLLKSTEAGYMLDTTYIDHRFKAGCSNPSAQEPIYTKKLINKMGFLPRDKNTKLTRAHKDFAASVQKSLETTVLHLIDLYIKEKPANNFCFAGGIALNAQLNKRIAYIHRFNNFFVQPVASDAGLALGGATYYAHKHDAMRSRRISHLYWGPQYANAFIENKLKKLKVPFLKSASIHKKIAAALHKGKIVAVFNGRMEYGPRALGHRSILASPHNKKIATLLNKHVKQRQTFQPFAASILQSCFSEYCNSPLTKTNFEHMIVNAEIKACAAKKIPAVVHKNMTSRIQCVTQKNAAFLYAILVEFRKISGLPILLNTSFNMKGQTIACTPQDAIAIFYSSIVDCLALNNFWIEKK